MSNSEENKPLSRRELRERQQAQGGAAVPRRVSEPVAPPVASAPNTATAPLNLVELRKLRAAAASGEVLTRRQLRDLERADSGALLSDAQPADTAVDPRVARENEARLAAERAHEQQRLADQERAAAAEQARQKAEAEAAAHAHGRRGTPRGQRRGSEEKAAAERAAAEQAQAETARVAAAEAAEAKQKAEAVQAAADRAIADQKKERPAAPQVGASFGLDSTGKKAAPSAFEDILARGVDTAQGTGSGTSALILPQFPTTGPLQTPIAGGTGEIIITGTIDLPGSLSNTGQHPNRFDKGELDTMFDHDEDPQPATAGNPVSASRAVSTHTATRDVIAAPTPAKNNRLLLILSITAGVLAAACVGVVITAIATGAIGG